MRLRSLTPIHSGPRLLSAPPPAATTSAHLGSGLCLALCVALCVAAFAPPADAQFWKRGEKPYPDGTEITITGVVADLSGTPVADVTVELFAARRAVKLGRKSDEIEREVSVSTTTNERGEFTLPWTWYRYYNEYALEAHLAVPTGKDSSRKEVLARTELNNRIEQGSPVIVPLTVTDPEFLNTFRAFVAGLDSEDEQRVYREVGRPDKVDTLELPDRVEQAWWFFRYGQVYRFVDGTLDQVERFEPIPDAR